MELRVTSSDGAVLSVDGNLNLPVEKGSGVRIQSSERKAKFLRERSSKEFYASLRGGWGLRGEWAQTSGLLLSDGNAASRGATEESRLAFERRLFDVRVDTVTRPGGQRTIREMRVIAPDSVSVVQGGRGWKRLPGPLAVGGGCVGVETNALGVP